MINDDQTLEEMRADSSSFRSYMSGADLHEIRTRVLKTTLSKLSEQLIRPHTGVPLSVSTLAKYEKGTRRIPQWVAQHVLLLAEAAQSYDSRR